MKTKLFVTSLVLLSTIASAESLEDKKYWKGEMDYINKTLDTTNESCGTKLTFDFVDKPKLRAEADKAESSASGVCDVIIDEIGGLCRVGDDEKQAVKAKIKGIRCGYSKPRSLAMTGGIVTYMGNNLEANVTEWARPWLMKHL
jgi:hypothetical protein